VSWYCYPSPQPLTRPRVAQTGKISTNSMNSTISAMDPYPQKSGKNSTNSINSMPTGVGIAGVAPWDSIPIRARPFLCSEWHATSIQH
jgi:hypothetical protein